MRTPPNARRLRRLSPSMPVLAALAAGLALPAACSDTEPEAASSQAPPRADAQAAALSRSLAARFPAAFRRSEAPLGVTVSLPRAADQPLRVRDDASKVEVAVSLAGSSAVEGAEVEGTAVFAGAAPEGGDLLLRRLAEGVEDLVHFAQKPRREALEYHLDLGAAAGLRLVENTLEVLDKAGIPVLRAAAPYVLDAAGRHEAALSVEGCAADTSPAAPFGKPVTPPGADRCTVKVDWSAAGVRYPALVDPVWGSTFNTMAEPRAHHTITLLNPASPTSLALVVGGVKTIGGAPLKSAEIYDPLSRRFSTTGSLTTARSDHSATVLTALAPALGEQPVLIAGGKDGAGNPLGKLEVYDPASGTFVDDGNTMATPRFEHAAVLIADKEVLLAGGTSPPLNQPTNTSYHYAFTGFTGAPPTGVMSTLALVGDPMESARTGLAVTRLTTGKVLLSGGFVLAGGALQALNTAEVFDPVTESFGPIETSGGGVVTLMATARGYHTSTALGASGAVLIAGGLSKTVGGTYTATADIYLDGSGGQAKGFRAVAIAMAAARSNHSATLMPDGRVLVAGGFNGSPAAAIGSAELFDPKALMFSDLGALVAMTARGDHAALLVNAGDSATGGHTVLVTGGSSAPNNGSAALAGAQILLRLNGDPCTVDDECLSGFCTDSVCCNKRCDEECYACSAMTKETGNDGTCGNAKQGSDPHVQCINQVETHTFCDGKGSTEQDPAQTKSCLPGDCGMDGYCSPGCNKTPDCYVTGWCDLTMPVTPFLGQCSQKKVNGAPCYGDDQCLSAFCVDGVCCGSKCDQQCQACDVPGKAGTCQTLGAADDPQDVHPNAGGMTIPPRAACDGFVGENGDERTACTGACKGKDLCDYPGNDVFIQADECKDDPDGGPSALTKFPCDTKGSSMEDPHDCAGFRCADEHTCKTSCTADTDCIADNVCIEGKCTALTGPLCDGKDTLRQPASMGGNQVCADNYACPSGATACLTECESINDCVTGTEDPVRIVCDGSRHCVAEPPAVTELPTCSAGSPGHGDSQRWWLAGGLGALAALLRRRRR